MTRILELGNSLKELTTKCVPRWRSELASDGHHNRRLLRLGQEETGELDSNDHRVHRLLRLLQEMLWWPLDSPEATAADLLASWQTHLSSQHLQWEQDEQFVLGEIWRGIKDVFAAGVASQLISTYLHFWNPLTLTRVTEPNHFEAAFADHWANSLFRRRTAFKLYLCLDTRGRKADPPLFTANKLLQQSHHPSDYSIHWDCERQNAEGAPSAILVDPTATRAIADALPGLTTWPESDWSAAAIKDQLDHLADEVYGQFSRFRASDIRAVAQPVNRVRQIFKDSMGNSIADEQALFFLFGLALNRKHFGVRICTNSQ